MPFYVAAEQGKGVFCMNMVLLQILLAAFFGWMGLPSIPYDLYIEGKGTETGAEEIPREEASEKEASASCARSVFSAYIVSGVDCMEDGSYDQYVKEAEASPESRSRQEDSTHSYEGFPKIYLKFMGLDLTDCRTADGQEYDHKAFCSNVFYMEYPWDWYVGATDASPLTFVPEWEEEASGGYIRDWAEYFDENLEGTTEEVQKYIEGGGINGYLEEVMGKPIGEEYELVLREKDSDWLLIYDLKKADKESAEIVVWCNLGKFSVRSWEVELTLEPEKDYGRILVFHEWKANDFSSKESIKAYVESADFLYRLLGAAMEEDVKSQIIAFHTKPFNNQYHEFVCVEVELCDKDDPHKILRQAAVYIPITKPYNENWVIVFETFPGSRQRENVYYAPVRERIMSTFVALPYYHQVKEGENLSRIAQYYGEDPDLAYEIASYWTNHIRKPDLIYPGQKLEIPLSVLFKRVHHK